VTLSRISVWRKAPNVVLLRAPGWACQCAQHQPDNRATQLVREHDEGRLMPATVERVDDAGKARTGMLGGPEFAADRIEDSGRRRVHHRPDRCARATMCRGVKGPSVFAERGGSGTLPRHSGTRGDRPNG
jgi:hypothetical protein